MPNIPIIRPTPAFDLIIPNLKIERPGPLEPSRRWRSSSELKPRRGPRPGSVARYAQSDRALFNDITRMMAKGISLMEAVRNLENELKVTGRGTPESRIRRVMRLYKKERLNARL